MKYSLFILLSFSIFSTAYTTNKIIYLGPCPRAKYVSTENNIIIGLDNPVGLNEQEINNCITVEGTKSGIHKGAVIICEGNKKILFKPSTPFQPGETVSFTMTGNLVKSVYPWRKKYSYRFTTSLYKVCADPTENRSFEGNYDLSSVPKERGLIQPPPLIVTINNNPSPGYLFTTPFNGYSSLVIVKNNGTPYWYQTVHSLSGDFKKQPNGDLTYYNEGTFKHYEMDINYNVVDTFYCGNGYKADIHELRVLNNSHALLMAYDTQTVDMSQIISGGNPHARVVGLIIQEIDENKNVVFQWRSWDHFQITDALHENLLDSAIDAVHGNSIDTDNDGNLIISSRHLDEITKINRTTGAIIWRFGGLNNQFTFINDTLRFNYQHAARRISNGNITIFDNGNFHNPPFSRAVEYSLDEQNMTATLVWQYRHDPDIFGSWGGYVQRLDGGNTLVGWGGTRPTLTEIEPSGTVVFEGSYQQNIYTYRTYKFDWNGAPIAVNGNNSEVPEAFKLNKNYPNPFNPSTTITFDIPRASFVELTVYDVTGRTLKHIVSEFKQPGSHSAVFDGSQYSSGLYICRLKAGDFTASEKMILIK